MKDEYKTLDRRGRLRSVRSPVRRGIMTLSDGINGSATAWKVCPAENKWCAPAGALAANSRAVTFLTGQRSYTDERERPSPRQSFL